MVRRRSGGHAMAHPFAVSTASPQPSAGPAFVVGRPSSMREGAGLVHAPIPRRRAEPSVPSARMEHTFGRMERGMKTLPSPVRFNVINVSCFISSFQFHGTRLNTHLRGTLVGVTRGYRMWR